MLELSLTLNLLIVLKNLFHNQENRVLIPHQMLKLIYLRKVCQELTIKRHTLISQLIVRPILFNNSIHHRQHDILLIIRLPQQVMLLSPLTIRRLLHQHYHILKQRILILPVYVKYRLLL